MSTRSSRSGTMDFRRLEMMARAEEANQGFKTPGKVKRSKRNDPISTKIHKLTLNNGSKESPWVEKYLPQSLAEHFVHKNKVAQFESWLLNTRGSKMCLLTGPAGAGKTATVYLVAAQHGYHVKEWFNPMSLTQYRIDDWKRDSGDEIQGRSAVEQFADFLLRSSQYPTLPVKGKQRGGTKSLVLVEDFPNFFYTDLPLLHQLMRNYKVTGECPLVFIMTDSTSVDCSSYKLFPKALLVELDIQEVTFNPVASSFMTKFANSVLAQTKTTVGDPRLLAEVIASSRGDMRSAINNLQFRLQTPKIVQRSSTVGPVSKKRKLDTNRELSLAVSKDESLFLFHAIGKVLYCKREAPEVLEPEICELNKNLVMERRGHPLKEVPEEIGDKMGVSPETFFNFLAQNYLTFFTSMTDIVNASSCITDAAVIFSSWVVDDVMNFNNKCDLREEFGLSVVIRGLMFANQSPVSSSWKPLRKPRFRDVNSVMEKMLQNTHAFCNGPVTRDYFTDLIPYKALIRPNKISQGERDFLKEFGRFHTIKSYGSNILEEANPDGGADDVMPELLSTSMVKEDVVDRATEESEQYNIEEVYD